MPLTARLLHLFRNPSLFPEQAKRLITLVQLLNEYTEALLFVQSTSNTSISISPSESADKNSLMMLHNGGNAMPNLLRSIPLFRLPYPDSAPQLWRFATTSQLIGEAPQRLNVCVQSTLLSRSSRTRFGSPIPSRWLEVVAHNNTFGHLTYLALRLAKASGLCLPLSRLLMLTLS